MKYIYDIILNFNDEYYEFFEWNKDDKMIRIKKIPIFKIDSHDLFKIKNNKVIFDNSFLNLLKNQTEYYFNRNTKKIKYAFLLCDDFEIIALNINEKNLYSSLQVDEELDILSEIDIKKTEIKYRVLSKNTINHFETRNKLERIKMIKKDLKKIMEEDNLEKLKYIYYECFDSIENDKNKILKRLTLSLDNINVLNKLNNFFDTLTFN